MDERGMGEGVAELGFATVDLARRERCGFPEVVFSEGKTAAWIEGVARRLAEAGQDCLATRVSDDQAAHLAGLLPVARALEVAELPELFTNGQNER